MKLEPLGDQIIVRLLDEAETEGGIYLPHGSEPRAEIVKVGPGSWTAQGAHIKPSVQPGDLVLLRKGRGTSIRFGGENHIFVTERDFMARIVD
jgi:co-chaperonin GroES (HSP10)